MNEREDGMRQSTENRGRAAENDQKTEGCMRNVLVVYLALTGKAVHGMMTLFR